MDQTVRQVIADDGTVITYRVLDGSTPAVVLLHGLAGSSRELIPTADGLSGRKVILIDQRGHGLSTRRPADTSREAFVADVIRIIETEESTPVDLVGQSMGAHTAMLVAAARPELVRRLVLLEGNEGGGSADEHDALGDFFRSWDAPFADEDAARLTLGDGPLATAWVADLERRADGLYPRFDPDVMVSTITHVAVPRWDAWEQVTAPTLVVYADGGMFTEEQKRRFTEGNENATRIDLVDASHDAHLDAFEQWINTVRSFIDDP